MTPRQLRALAKREPAAFRKLIKGARDRELTARRLLLHPELVHKASQANLDALREYLEDRGWSSMYNHDRRMWKMLRAGAKRVALELQQLDLNASREFKKAFPSKKDLRFISESMELSGFSGRIPPPLRKHKPDMGSIAATARKFGAQVPACIIRAIGPAGAALCWTVPYDEMPRVRRIISETKWHDPASFESMLKKLKAFEFAKRNAWRISAVYPDESWLYISEPPFPVVQWLVPWKELYWVRPTLESSDWRDPKEYKAMRKSLKQFEVDP